MLRRFLQDENGQDLIEYSLLLAFVVLCSAALLCSGQEHIASIWNTTDNHLTSAKSMAS